MTPTPSTRSAAYVVAGAWLVDGEVAVTLEPSCRLSDAPILCVYVDVADAGNYTVGKLVTCEVAG